MPGWAGHIEPIKGTRLDQYVTVTAGAQYACVRLPARNPDHLSGVSA